MAGDLQSVMAQIWREHAADIADRLAALDAAAAAVLAGDTASPALVDGRRAAHKLAGALGTFGLPDGTRLARELEDLLAEASPHALRVAELAERLHAIVDAGPQSSEAGANAVRRPALIEVAPAGRAPKTRDLLEREGVATWTTDRADELDAWLATMERAPAVLVDSALAGWEDIVIGLATRRPLIRTAILVDGDVVADHVRMARLGARLVLPRGGDARSAATALRALIDESVSERPRVLAIDDDKTTLDATQAALAVRELRLEVSTDAESFWRALDEIAPDAVVVDVDMPGIDGISLCRALRTDPRWSGLPIVFLSGLRDADTIAAAFAAGADDYLTKPVDVDELAMRLRNRIARARRLRAAGETDRLTGLATRGHATDMIERALRLAARTAEPLAIALIDVDGLKRVNDGRGHDAGDALLQRLASLLRSSFRERDVLARWGGDEFVVAMPSTTRAVGAERVAAFLTALRAGTAAADASGATASASAGLAAYPDDGGTTAELVAAADVELYRAKSRTGAARSPRSGPDERLDVLVVDDDEALGDLLVHAIGNRGWRVDVVRDGHAALARLRQEPTPRVVLLDVELPGIDGFAVLRELERLEITRRAKVIMLTVRANELEVLGSLRAGAAEHVAKPFSLPVLVERIRAALGEERP